MKRITLLLPLLLLATACVPSRSAIAPSVESAPVKPSPESVSTITTPEPSPVRTDENVPTVLKSEADMLVVDPNKTFVSGGLEIDVVAVQVDPTGVGILVRLENVSNSPAQLYSTLSAVVVGSRQIEYSALLAGEISSEIYPGVVQEGIMGYFPGDPYVVLDVQQISDLRWIVDTGSDPVTVELNLRPPGGGEPSTEPFNAEIFDPPSNCRTGANVSSSVKQALQRGDVLVDRSNTRSDDKGGIWYREKYLDCWIHESQLRFK